MESQLKVNQERLKYFEKLNLEMPDLMVHESAKWDVVYKDALEGLVRRIQDRIYGLAIRMLYHLADAEDATQKACKETKRR